MPFDDIIGHTTPIQWLQRAIKADRLSHAYLFAGESSIGKRQTAIRFAQALHCDQAVPYAIPDSCGTCRACRQILIETHPDYMCIRPEGDQANPQIKIDRVREIEHHVIYRPLSGLRKICLIDDADRMTIGAANALLKTLEEPPDHSLFILVTSRPSSLPSTIQSRCFRINFSTPSRHSVERYLMEKRQLAADDARLVSLLTDCRLGEALALDVAEIRTKREELFTFLTRTAPNALPALLDQAEQLAKTSDVHERMRWLWYGLRDLLVIAAGYERPILFSPEMLPDLQKLARAMPMDRLLSLLDCMHDLEQGIGRNLNMQLGLERLFLTFHEAVHAPR